MNRPSLGEINDREKRFPQAWKVVAKARLQRTEGKGMKAQGGRNTSIFDQNDKLKGKLQ